MALKRLITKAEFDSLHDVLKPEYQQEGENYILATDDESFISKINEFRSNNVALMKEQESLLAQVEKYKGIDPELAREAQQKLQDLEEEKLRSEQKFDELFEKRTERMQAEFNNKYGALETAHNNLLEKDKSSTSLIHDLRIRSDLASEINNIGTVRQGAMDHIFNYAKGVWSLDENNKLVPKKGDEIIYGKDGKTSMTPAEWSQQLLQEAPYFFEGNSGSNANGSGNNNGTSNTINRNDKAAFGANIENIAAGKVKAV